MKTLYIDTETTGTDPRSNGVIQIAAIMTRDHEEVGRFNIKCAPYEGDEIEEEALRITGTDRAELMTRMSSSEAYHQFTEFLGKHIDKFDKNDKAYIAGYNVRFDVDMMRAFFMRHGDKYFGSWFNNKIVDGLPIMHMLSHIGIFGGNEPENYKLSTVCEKYGIAINAHDSMSDIEATKKLIDRITGGIARGIAYAKKDGLDGVFGTF